MALMRSFATANLRLKFPFLPARPFLPALCSQGKRKLHLAINSDSEQPPENFGISESTLRLGAELRISLIDACEDTTQGGLVVEVKDGECEKRALISVKSALQPFVQLPLPGCETCCMYGRGFSMLCLERRQTNTTVTVYEPLEGEAFNERKRQVFQSGYCDRSVLEKNRRPLIAKELPNELLMMFRALVIARAPRMLGWSFYDRDMVEDYHGEIEKLESNR